MSREHVIEKIVSVLQDNGYTVLQESKTMKIYSGKRWIGFDSDCIPPWDLTEADEKEYVERIVEKVEQSFEQIAALEVYDSKKLFTRLSSEEGSDKYLSRKVAPCIFENICVCVDGVYDTYVRVSQELLKIWGTPEEELWKSAENNAMQEGIYFNSLGKTLDEIQEDYPEYKNEPVNSLSPLFILSNKSKKFGASVITLPGVLEKVAERLDDSFLCIPSSIHEWLILRDKDGEYFSQDEIRHTILEVNSSCVDEGEFLSNNLYHYDRMRKKFEIVDE